MSHRGLAVSVAALALVLTACTSRASAPAGSALSASPPLSTVYPAHCQAQDHGQLPDPGCTPGATNPAVTQTTIDSTICRSGWTATIRPPTSYTDRIKRLAVSAYGSYAGTALGNYELDHLISLELGGAPTATANLWPEKGLHNAKDLVENAAHRAVCTRRINLAEAQRAIAGNWIAFGHRLEVAGVPAG